MLRTTKKNLLPQTRTEYPNGTFVETSKGLFYIAGPEKRLRILTSRVLASWSPPRVVQTTDAALAGYRVTSKMKFRNGSLLNSLADGRIYLIEDGKRRHVTNPDALLRLGARYSDAVHVSLDEIKLHPEGEPIS